MSVSVDGVPQALLHLPQPTVARGQVVTLHTPFRAPDDEGPCRLRVELVHQGVTSFTDQGVDPWQIDVNVVAAPMTESVRLHEIARKHNPWYYNPLTGIPESRDGHPFPLFISRAKGARVWDVEGNEFLDYTMGWGSTILGHAEDRIQDAIRQVLDDGTILPFPHPAGDGRLEDAGRGVPWQRHGDVRQERLRRVHHRGAPRPRRDQEDGRSCPAASMAGRTLRWTISVSKTAVFPAVPNGRSTNSPSTTGRGSSRSTTSASTIWRQ